MWMPYLNSVVQAHGGAIPAGRLQEMKTICAALTKGGEGEFRGLMDILAQRLLSLEARTTGQPELAQGLELVDSMGQGLASSNQLHAASRKLLEDSRLQMSIDRLRANR